MRITGSGRAIRALKDNDKETLEMMANIRKADEVYIEYGDFYDGYNTRWNIVAKFKKSGKVIDWCTI